MSAVLISLNTLNRWTKLFLTGCCQRLYSLNWLEISCLEYIKYFLIKTAVIPKVINSLRFSSVQLLSCVWLSATPWTAACQTSLSITNSWSLLKLMSIKLVMSSNHLNLCHPLLLLPSIFLSIRLAGAFQVLLLLVLHPENTLSPGKPRQLVILLISDGYISRLAHRSLFNPWFSWNLVLILEEFWIMDKIR